MSYATRSILPIDSVNGTYSKGRLETSNEVSTVGVVTWREVFAAASSLVKSCTARDNVGGYVVLLSGKQPKSPSDLIRDREKLICVPYKHFFLLVQCLHCLYGRRAHTSVPS